MSDPTQVCVAVVMEEYQFGDCLDNHDSFTDYMDEKYGEYTYRNEDWKEGMPSQITFGYESSAAWGIGQNSVFQSGHDETVGDVFIIGYELASTWNGVIVLNEELLDEITRLRHKLETLFPDFTPQVIVRGFQV